MLILCATAWPATALRVPVHLLAADYGTTRWLGQVGVPFGSPGLGGQVNPRRHSLAAVPAQAPGSRQQFWPFDCTAIQAGKSAVTEVCPSHRMHISRRCPHADQHDAFAVASWLSEADRSG